MALVKSSASTLSHGGVTYEPDAHGVFEVPHELGEWLVRVHGWFHDDGTHEDAAPAPAAAPEKPAEPAVPTVAGEPAKAADDATGPDDKPAKK